MAVIPVALRPFKDAARRGRLPILPVPMTFALVAASGCRGLGWFRRGSGSGLAPRWLPGVRTGWASPRRARPTEKPALCSLCVARTSIVAILDGLQDLLNCWTGLCTTCHQPLARPWTTHQTARSPRPDGVLPGREPLFPQGRRRPFGHGRVGVGHQDPGARRVGELRISRSALYRS